jgi:hypothetical protein
MVITIWVEDQHPVAGRAGVDDQPPRPFAGWLQLLGLLADLVEGKELGNYSAPSVLAQPRAS